MLPWDSKKPRLGSGQGVWLSRPGPISKPAPSSLTQPCSLWGRGPLGHQGGQRRKQGTEGEKQGSGQCRRDRKREFLQGPCCRPCGPAVQWEARALSALLELWYPRTAVDSQRGLREEIRDGGGTRVPVPLQTLVGTTQRFPSVQRPTSENRPHRAAHVHARHGHRGAQGLCAQWRSGWCLVRDTTQRTADPGEGPHCLGWRSVSLEGDRCSPRTRPG